MDYLANIPVLRKELEEFIEEYKYWHENIHFDWSYMDYYEKKNLWFLDILSDKNLKQKLLT